MAKQNDNKKKQENTPSEKKGKTKPPRTSSPKKTDS